MFSIIVHVFYEPEDFLGKLRSLKEAVIVGSLMVAVLEVSFLNIIGNTIQTSRLS